MNKRENKVMENGLRRVAARQGLRLMKSYARNPRDITYGTYQLVDAKTNALVFSDWNGRGYGLSLEDVDQYLMAPDPTIRVDRAHDDEYPSIFFDDSNDPIIHYRSGSTTKGRIPDGWVLSTIDADETILGGARDDEDEAIAMAQEHLRRYGRLTEHGWMLSDHVPAWLSS